MVRKMEKNTPVATVVMECSVGMSTWKLRRVVGHVRLHQVFIMHASVNLPMHIKVLIILKTFLMFK